MLRSDFHSECRSEEGSRSCRLSSQGCGLPSLTGQQLASFPLVGHPFTNDVEVTVCTGLIADLRSRRPPKPQTSDTPRSEFEFEFDFESSVVERAMWQQGQGQTQCQNHLTFQRW